MSLSMPTCSHRAVAFPESQIRHMVGAAESRPAAIHLEIGEPDFTTESHIIRAAARDAESGLTHYPAIGGLPSLKIALSEKIQSIDGYTVDSDRIAVTAGATCGIFALLMALLSPGDEVLIPTPGYPAFEDHVRFAGGTPTYYHLRPEHGFVPQLRDLEQAIGKRTRVLFINTPSNPTGAVYPAELMRGLVELTRERRIWLMSDEVYDQIILDDDREHVAAGRFDESGRVISIYSFSKTYAMTGWRVGYIVAPRELAAIMRKTDTLMSYASIVSQRAALAALKGSQTGVRERLHAYRSRRDAVLKILAREGMPPIVRPQGTFYLLVSIADTGMRSMEFSERLLADADVVVAPGSVFGPAGDQYVRLSLASDMSSLREGVQRLVTCVRRWSRASGAAG